MSTPRKHHYLPQMYLKGFASLANPRSIYVYDKDEGRKRPSTVKNEAHIRDYYSLDTQADSAAVEAMLSKLETIAAPLLRRVAAGERLERNDRVEFAGFIALCMTRVPNGREAYAEVGRAQLRALGNELFANEEFWREVKEGRPEGDEEDEEAFKLVRQSLTDGKYDIEIKDWWTLGAMINAPKLGAIINRMNWTIIRAAPKSFFVTGDNPVTRTPPDAGLMGEVLFPIDRRTLLLASWNSLPPLATATVDQMKLANRRVIENAERWVYASEDDSDILAQAIQARGSAPRVVSG